MLVGAGDGRVGADRPILALSLITAGPQPIQDLFPRTIQRPATMPVIDRLPVPVALRQIPPRTPCPGTEDHPVDHRPMAPPPATSPRRGRGQQPLQPLPLLVRQIMTIQPLTHTQTVYQYPSIKIHGTRPSRRGRAGPRPHAPLRGGGGAASERRSRHRRPHRARIARRRTARCRCRLPRLHRPAGECSGSCRASRHLLAACRLSLLTAPNPAPFLPAAESDGGAPRRY